MPGDLRASFALPESTVLCILLHAQLPPLEAQRALQYYGASHPTPPTGAGVCLIPQMEETKAKGGERSYLSKSGQSKDFFNFISKAKSVPNSTGQSPIIRF